MSNPGTLGPPAPDAPFVSALDRAQRQTARWLFLGLWALYALVGPWTDAVGSNAITRLALPFSILERGSVIIDPFAPFTADRAFIDGHYTIDKVPGQSFLALPVIAIARAVAHLAGYPHAAIVDGQLSAFMWLCAWLVAATTTAPFAAAAAASVFRTAIHLGASNHAALFSALFLGLGTPAFGWATLVFGHMIAAGCLALAFEASLVLAAGGCRVRHAVTVGLLMALSVTVEITSALPMMVIGLFCTYHALARGGAAERASVCLILLSAAIAMIPFGLYNHVAFGSAFALGYANVTGFEGMKSGFFGISAPRPWTLLSILVVPRRGILWLAPLLAAAPLAWDAARKQWTGSVMLVLTAVPVLYLVINSGYYYWDGGGSTGPRHIIPALPFVCLLFAPLWDSSHGRSRLALNLAAILGAIVSAAAAMVDMTVDPRILWPVTASILPRFARGEVHNLFHALGMPGTASALVLTALGVAFVTSLARALPPSSPRRTSPTPAAAPQTP